jgi:hypothetical protein
MNENTIRRPSALLAAAALAGLLTGSSVNALAVSKLPGIENNQNSPGVMADEGAAKKGETHACAGKNSCKGKGGCKSGDKGCAGKNTCKGKGGCAVKDGKPAHKL